MKQTRTQEYIETKRMLRWADRANARKAAREAGEYPELAKKVNRKRQLWDRYLDSMDFNFPG